MTAPRYVYSGFVRAGHVVSGATIDANDDVTVLRGGTVVSITVESAGSLGIAKGGLAVATTVDGGFVILSGTAVDTALLSGATLDVLGASQATPSSLPALSPMFMKTACPSPP